MRSLAERNVEIAQLENRLNELAPTRVSFIIVLLFQYVCGWRQSIISMKAESLMV